jgi:hypothetical protein
MQLTLAHIKARVERLERLALGLGQEAVLQRGAVDVLLYREKKHSLAGIHDAQAGVEAARVVLAGAARRLGGGGAGA